GGGARERQLAARGFRGQGHGRPVLGLAHERATGRSALGGGGERSARPGGRGARAHRAPPRQRTRDLGRVTRAWRAVGAELEIVINGSSPQVYAELVGP